MVRGPKRADKGRFTAPVPYSCGIWWRDSSQMLGSHIIIKQQALWGVCGSLISHVGCLCVLIKLLMRFWFWGLTWWTWVVVQLLTLFPPSISQQKVIQVGQMDREARRLGRSLVKSEEDDEGDDYDDDLMDLEASNVILTPLLRSDLLSLHDSGFLYVVKLSPCQCSVHSRFRPISASVAAATPKIRSFQVRPFNSFPLFIWHLWAAAGKASEAILLLSVPHCYAMYVHMRTGERECPWGPEARRREHQPCRFHSCGKPEEKHNDPEIYQLPLLQRGRVISRRTKET